MHAECHVSSDQIGSQVLLQSGGSMLKEVGTLSLRHHRCVAAGTREMTVEGTEESYARRDRKELE